MKRFLALAVALAASLPIRAQQEDTIHWIDGTVLEGVRVTDFTVFEIKWQARGAAESKSADQVRRVDIKRVNEAYKRAFSAPLSEQVGQFLLEAEKRAKAKDFLAQFGFQEAANRLLENAEWNEGFQTLEKMVAAIPDAGLLPELYRQKLAYYLGRGKEAAKEAQTVAKKYTQQVTSQSLPKGFAVEAEYYELMADVAAGMSDGDFATRLQALMGRAEGVQPMIANRVRLQIARIAQNTGKVDDARRIYDELLRKPAALDQDTHALALVGTGHLHFKAADATNLAAYRAAMMAYLRAYVLCPEADDETKAEALYHAAQAAERWKGADARLIQGRTRAVLRRDFAETTWGKRG